MGRAAAHAHCRRVQVRVCGRAAGCGPFCTAVPTCVPPHNITTAPPLWPGTGPSTLGACSPLQATPLSQLSSVPRVGLHTAWRRDTCPLAPRPLPPQLCDSHAAVKLHSWHQPQTSPLPTLTARKVTELLRTFCESKRLTTDKVRGLHEDGQLGGGSKPGVGTSPHSVPRPTSKTCPTS